MEELKKENACVSDESFSKRVLEDIDEKDFCCVYLYTGKRNHGIIRYLINNGKPDIHKWIISREIDRDGLSVTDIKEPLRELVRKNSGRELACKYINDNKFPDFFWKDIRFIEANTCKENSHAISLSYRGVLLVKTDKTFSFEEIKTVSQFIKYSIALSSSLNKNNRNLYYRGQLAHWDLNPSLFRKKEWVEHESELNAQIICDRPNDFADCRTTFDRLVKLKHYNQPSRLLDLTSNPLVGLFFACDCMVADATKSSIGMVVFAFSEEGKEKISVSSDTVTLLSALSNTKRFKGINSVPEECKRISGEALPNENDSSKCNKCELIRERCNLKHDGLETDEKTKNAEVHTVYQIERDNYMGELIHQCKKESGSELYWSDLCYGELNQCILVWPPLNNNRIVQQQGCFIMSGSNPLDLNKPPASLRNFFKYPVLDDKTKPKSFQWKRFFILPSNLEKILSELKVFGIDKYFIYPDLEKDIGVRKDLISDKYGKKSGKTTTL